MTTPTNPPPNPPYRTIRVHRGWSNAIVAVVVVVLIGLFFWARSSNAAPGTQAANPTAGNDCVATNTDLTKAVLVPLYFPASSSVALTELDKLRGGKITSVIYAGEEANVNQANVWLDRANCNGLNAAMKMDTAFRAMSDSNVISYVRSIDSHVSGEGYYVAYNDVPKGTKESAKKAILDHKVAVLHQATAKPVNSMTDLPAIDVSTATSVTRTYAGDRKVIVYLGMSPWGTPSGYKLVGQVVHNVDAVKAEAGVQAYDAGQGQPTPPQVGGFAKSVAAADVHRILMYTEEDKEGSADNPTYLLKCAEEVDKAIS